jgi:hypothetical protein
MKSRENIIFAVFFILVPLFLFRDGLAYGKIFNAFDTITLDIPFRMFAQEMFFKYHQLPFWLPGILTGIPLIDSTNLMYFYPPAIFTMVLGIPAWATCTAFVILHMIFSAAGMYLFLKSSGLNKPGALFGAMAFMTSGIVVSYVAAGHLGNIIAATFIPWIFYFFMRGYSEKKYFWYLSAGLCLAFQVLCIGMQIMAYTFIGSAFFIAWLHYGKKDPIPKAAAVLAAVTAACVIFSAPQFFASLKYLGHSWRNDSSYELFTSWSFNPAESLTFIFPQFFGVVGKSYWGFMPSNANTFYMGIIPFLLVPAAFINGKKKGFPLFFGVLAVLFLMLGFGGYTPLYRIVYHIPLLNSMRAPCRFLYLFTFCVTVLAAIGASNICEASGAGKREAKKVLTWTIAATGVILAFITVFFATGIMRWIVSKMFNFANSFYVNNDGLDTIMKAILKDVAAFAVISSIYFLTVFLFINRRIKSAFVAGVILCGVHFIDIERIEKQFINYIPVSGVIQENNPAADYLKMDKGLYRVFEPENRLTPNLNLYYGIEFLNGYHGLSQAKYIKMYYAGDFNRLNVSRMMNVKYIMQQEERAPGELIKVFDNGLKIYKDPGCLPRFYVARYIVNQPSEDEVYRYITAGNYVPGQAVVSGHPELAVTAGKPEYGVNVEEYTPTHIRLSVTSSGGMLVFSNYYYESWKALLDKKEDKIYNVNYMNSGIILEPGSHKIELYFDGWYIYAGIFAALAALLAYAAYYLYDIKGIWRKGHGKKQ